MTTTKRHQVIIKQSQEWAAKAETRIDKVIAKNFNASFMSNAKWRKIFTLLANSNYLIDCYQRKFVDDERLFKTPILKISELDERHLIDGVNQPFVYKDIEWLEVVTNSSKEITTELLKRGQFALDESELGFRIVGYARRK